MQLKPVLELAPLQTILVSCTRDTSVPRERLGLAVLQIPNLGDCSIRRDQPLEKGANALGFRRSLTIERIQTRVNNQIRISPLRVIGPDGTQYGVITVEEALSRARDAGLDLVEVAPNERPPVCRIMDFGKYKYEKNKKSGQKTHQTKTKEIRLRPKTGDHDVETKVRQAIGFLKHKDKVQVTVMFRGREMAHVEEGRRVMEHVINDLAEYSKIEQAPSQQGKKMIAMLAPK